MGAVMQAVAASAATPIIEWSVRTRALEGESESGDHHVIAPFAQGILVAVIDGLGHGTEAAAAARQAAASLADNAEEPVMDLMRRCHKALYKTRGAVISIASINAVNDTMTWIGVGNVEGMLFRMDKAMQPSRESLTLRGGVVGYQLPPLRAASFPLVPGDVLIFVTDGIGSSFSHELELDRHCDTIAADIFSDHAKDTDDALVLVVRYLGVRR
jgi:serine phosphatase RsbU (regulator of sigma subunit)